MTTPHHSARLRRGTRRRGIRVRPPGRTPPGKSRTSCWCTAASSTAPAGRASTTLLKKDGYNVSIVQNPTTSLADDVAATKRALDAQDGPVILVGHSYGGVVITEAGNRSRRSQALVYIAAFAPDEGESVSTLIANPPPGAPVPPILPPQDGFLFLDKAKFPASFAADVDADDGGLHGRLAGAVGRRARSSGAVTEPAWKTKPSWYLVATDDQMIPPDAQRAMAKRAGATVVEDARQPRDLRVEAGRRRCGRRACR